MLSALSFCIFLYSCAADHIPPIAKGNVAVFDEYASAAGYPSNVKVRLEGGDATRETLTDKDGDWSFKDVPAGTYDIILSKEGFSTYKILRTPHVGVALLPCRTAMSYRCTKRRLKLS
ncbi:carboxypeptidase-like regulatory domain-containing protein [Dyadobacter psychrophilus]|uniref:carboxypeptidase-like regulatory domain-containing protein n=1 Tax=Dyadobacter psychrophilus TaxID=651661 RepID=UPI0009E47795